MTRLHRRPQRRLVEHQVRALRGGRRRRRCCSAARSSRSALAPRLTVVDAAGETRREQQLDRRPARPSRARPREILTARPRAAGRHGRCSASAIASCTAACDYAAPVRDRRRGAGRRSRRWCRWRRCTSRTTWRRSEAIAEARARPAAGRLLRHRLPPQPAGAGADLRAAARASPTPASGATASTACPTNTSPRACRESTPALARGRRGRRPSRQRRQPVRAARRAAASPAPWASPPLDGLLMGTRCGALDPGVLLYLMDEPRHGRPRRRGPALPASPGLLGVSGISRDMRDAAGQSTEPRGARGDRPLRLPHRRARSARWPPRWAGSTAWSSPAASARTRAPSCASASAQAAPGWASSSTRRPTPQGGPRISTAGSRIAAWVIPTDEELMIARHTRARLRRLRTTSMPTPGQHERLPRPRRAEGAGRRRRQRALDRLRLRQRLSQRSVPSWRSPTSTRRRGRMSSRWRRRSTRRSSCRSTSGSPAQVEAVFDAHRQRSGAGSTSWCTRSPSRPRTTCRAAWSTAPREGFLRGDGRLLPVLHPHGAAGEPLMTEGGTMIAMSYLGAQKVVPNYNVMGPVKAALEAACRYLAYELGPQGHPRAPGVARPAEDPRGVRAEGLRPAAQRGREPRAGAASWSTSTTWASPAPTWRRRMRAALTGQTLFVDGGVNIMG